MTNVVPLNAGAKNQLVSDAAEHGLLGILLTNPARIADLPSAFDPSHYAYPDHADIHRAIVEVGRPGTPAALAVMQTLALNDPEQREYIGKLLAAPASHKQAMVAEYAGIIIDMFRRRQLVSISDAIREGAFSTKPAESTMALAAVGLEQIDHHATLRSSMSLNAAMDLAMKRADEAAQRNGPAGASTGFPSIDEMLGGLEDGTLTVIGGRPGMGKSALGHRIALNVARTARAAMERGEDARGVLEISLEMSAVELGRRALSAISGVPVSVMKKGRHGPFADRIIKARHELHGLPLTIEDGGGQTASMISLKARAAQRRHGLGLIMIDHLHIVRPDDADVKLGATWAVGRISGAMKRLAKEFGCPVLLLAQLNRGVEGRDDKRPNLADLRQSGDIEQDADAVGFVYRAEYYLQKDPERLQGDTDEKFANRLSQHEEAKHAARGKAELIFAKVRDGHAGTIPLLFDGETTSFSEPCA